MWTRVQPEFDNSSSQLWTRTCIQGHWFYYYILPKISPPKQPNQQRYRLPDEQREWRLDSWILSNHSSLRLSRDTAKWVIGFESEASLRHHRFCLQGIGFFLVSEKKIVQISSNANTSPSPPSLPPTLESLANFQDPPGNRQVQSVQGFLRIFPQGPDHGCVLPHCCRWIPYVLPSSPESPPGGAGQSLHSTPSLHWIASSFSHTVLTQFEGTLVSSSFGTRMLKRQRLYWVGNGRRGGRRCAGGPGGRSRGGPCWPWQTIFFRKLDIKINRLCSGKKNQEQTCHISMSICLKPVSCR